MSASKVAEQSKGESLWTSDSHILYQQQIFQNSNSHLCRHQRSKNSINCRCPSLNQMPLRETKQIHMISIDIWINITRPKTKSPRILGDIHQDCMSISNVDQRYKRASLSTSDIIYTLYTYQHQMSHNEVEHLCRHEILP